MLPIVLRGAETHNLKCVDLVLAPATLVALTGPSGSGKSSLALDTLYAEGQRRYVESFSPYARQFLDRLERPPVLSLEPIAATVAVDRRAPVKSSRSTLATLADLEPYFAALFGCEAIPVCPECHVPAVPTRAAEAATRVTRELEGARAVVSYPVSVDDAEGFLALRETLLSEGYRRLVVGGKVQDLDQVRPSEATAKDVRVEVVVDRVVLAERDRGRVQQALEIAWERGSGRAEIRAETEGGARHLAVGRGLVCPSCARSFEPARAGLFSYNSPLGACQACKGFGRTIEIDWDKVVPDPDKSLARGALKAWAGKSADWERGQLLAFCKRHKIPMDVPWARLTEAQRGLVIEGEGPYGSGDDGKFPGVRRWFKWLESRTYKMHVRVFLSRYRDYVACGECQGVRLNATARSYEVTGLDLGAWHRLAVSSARARVADLQPSTPQGRRVKEALASRLGYLEAVGLGYLSLDRQARSLSGGEAQRAGLTNALGASLTGTLFVLDEPTVGLHPTDVPPLATAMRELAQAGNTVLVVEHDPLCVRAADRVVELGPGAGKEGGTVLFDGTPQTLARRTDTPTGRAWRARPIPRAPRAASSHLILEGVRAHNLQGIDVTFPLGVLCALTGPSGSGKSTLAEDVLYRAVARATGETGAPRPLHHEALRGAEALARAVLVDQSPLGRTARGNAATYTKAWDRVRERFSQEPEAKASGLTAAHFSFNVAGKGRCEACSGEGYETVEMQFLADVQLLCAVCRGKRFQPEVLAVRHMGVGVAELLSMTVKDALEVLDPGDARDHVLFRALEPVVKVGLGYLPLGQPLSTLSGGEAQRLKLARALGDKKRGTLYVLDEPSAGLHAEDAAKVVAALHQLVAEGASVVVVEHDLDIVRSCDFVVDLGPGGGPEGGRVVACGTPEELARADTRTGRALRDDATKGKGAPGKAVKHEASAVHSIEVVHAREHTLKEISCGVPHGALTVVTGPSGSGKSSLAFDVIFAEGQRRFMETLTPYARQFLPTLPRADVDAVYGVPPSIALEQRTTRGGASSTVATVTEIAHYLRLLFAKVGDVHCPECDTPVDARSSEEIFQSFAADTRRDVTVYSPAVRGRKGTYKDLFTRAARAGIAAARVDGAIVTIDPPPPLTKTKEHTVDLIVHYGPPAGLSREILERALSLGAGAVRVASGAPTATPRPDEELLSTARACPRCGTGVPELDPRWFSFNTKQGQCPSCEGTGAAGGPAALEAGGPLRLCKACEGSRLAPVPRRVRLSGETYAAFTSRGVAGALAAASSWAFSGRRAEIAKAPLAELLRRLAFVDEVGLGYLALSRPAATLSGGEMQRLRLSAQLGSGLTGALYVLDEPTIGLHPRDTGRLVKNLRALVATGSTVLVVEHDAEMIHSADHVIDMGPGGGSAGGHIVAAGPAARVLSDPRSPTAVALADTARVVRPDRPPPTSFLELGGARANNLRDVTFRVPVGRLTVVAGVSGSGKSTLVSTVFFPALRRALGLVAEEPGPHDRLLGTGAVKRAIAVDQSPIGRTPRSVPATFLGIWDDIRKLYAGVPEAKAQGYGPGRFSFNSAKGGRCPACEGQGAIVHEMSFLPDVVSPCETCGGARFEPSTLDVKYKDMSVGDVLRLSASEAGHLFSAHRRIARPLGMLEDLGVGYLRVGQGSNTLSGGEAQRLKLAAELTAGSQHEPTVYVLDEPTTGLHLSDVKRLLLMLEKLVERGDTLVVVEHHPDVVASADWVVELGPGAGEGGGRVIFEGHPSELARADTPTGHVLASPALKAPRAKRLDAKGPSSAREPPRVSSKP